MRCMKNGKRTRTKELTCIPKWKLTIHDGMPTVIRDDFIWSLRKQLLRIHVTDYLACYVNNGHQKQASLRHAVRLWHFENCRPGLPAYGCNNQRPCLGQNHLAGISHICSKRKEWSDLCRVGKEIVWMPTLLGVSPLNSLRRGSFPSRH